MYSVVKCWTVFILISMTVIRGYCEVTIISPSPLNGAKVCPGIIFELRCVARNIFHDAVIRWFYSDNNSTFAVKRYTRNEMLPSPFDFPSGIIDGIAIDLISVSYIDDRFSGYESIMRVNLSVYDVTIIRRFHCGSVLSNSLSNSISLNFTIKTPENPNPSKLIASYNSSYHLEFLILMWIQQEPSEKCLDIFNYRVSVINDLGESDKEYIVRFDACINQTCSVRVRVNPRPFLDEERYTVRIRTGDVYDYSVVQEQNYTETLAFSISHFFTFEICASYFLCSSMMECGILYSEHPIHQVNTSHIIQGSLNESIILDDVKDSTDYNFRIVLSLNSSFEREIRGTFRNDLSLHHLTTSNIGFLSAGILISIIHIIIASFFAVSMFVYKNGLYFEASQTVRCVIVICGVIVGMLEAFSLVFCIVLGQRVGLQDDTCDLEWQSTRNILIILSFVFSIVVFLSISTVTFISISISTKGSTLCGILSRNKTPSEPPSPSRFYMKTNQVYKPENFDGPNEDEQTVVVPQNEDSDRLYDFIPDCNQNTSRSEPKEEEVGQSLYSRPHGERAKGGCTLHLQGDGGEGSGYINLVENDQPEGETPQEDHLYDLPRDNSSSLFRNLSRKKKSDHEIQNLYQDHTIQSYDQEDIEHDPTIQSRDMGDTGQDLTIQSRDKEDTTKESQSCYRESFVTKHSCENFASLSCDQHDDKENPTNQLCTQSDNQSLESKGLTLSPSELVSGNTTDQEVEHVYLNNALYNSPSSSDINSSGRKNVGLEVDHDYLNILHGSPDSPLSSDKHKINRRAKTAKIEHDYVNNLPLLSDKRNTKDTSDVEVDHDYLNALYGSSSKHNFIKDKVTPDHDYVNASPSEEMHDFRRENAVKQQNSPPDSMATESHEYINEKDIRSFRNAYVNQDLEKKEWPYGYVA